MDEYNPFKLNQFEWNILKEYLKNGNGNMKLYDTTFFTCNLTDETVCLTLEEFANMAQDYDGNYWCVIEDEINNDWIPYDDKHKIPADARQVLVTYMWADDDYEVSIAEYWGNEELLENSSYGFGFGKFDEYVIAWKELPEPYMNETSI